MIRVTLLREKRSKGIMPNLRTQRELGLPQRDRVSTEEHSLHRGTGSPQRDRISTEGQGLPQRDRISTEEQGLHRGTGSPTEGQGLPQRNRVSHSTTLLTAMGGTTFTQVLWPMNTAGRFLLRTSECEGCLSRVTSIFSEQLLSSPSPDWDPDSSKCQLPLLGTPKR